MRIEKKPIKKRDIPTINLAKILGILFLKYENMKQIYRGERVAVMMYFKQPLSTTTQPASQ